MLLIAMLTQKKLNGTMKTKLEQSKCESLQKLKILVHTFLEN